MVLLLLRSLPATESQEAGNVSPLPSIHLPKPASSDAICPGPAPTASSPLLPSTVDLIKPITASPPSIISNQSNAKMTKSISLPIPITKVSAATCQSLGQAPPLGTRGSQSEEDAASSESSEEEGEEQEDAKDYGKGEYIY